MAALAKHRNDFRSHKMRGIVDQLCDQQLFKDNPARIIYFAQVTYLVVFHKRGPPR